MVTKNKTRITISFCVRSKENRMAIFRQTFVTIRNLRLSRDCYNSKMRPTPKRQYGGLRCPLTQKPNREEKHDRDKTQLRK